MSDKIEDRRGQNTVQGFDQMQQMVRDFVDSLFKFPAGSKTRNPMAKALGYEDIHKPTPIEQLEQSNAIMTAADPFKAHPRPNYAPGFDGTLGSTGEEPLRRGGVAIPPEPPPGTFDMLPKINFDKRDQGTIIGAFNRLFRDEATRPPQVNVGSATEANLNPTAPGNPVSLPEAPAKPDYSMATMPPNAIYELRQSLLKDSGQAGDPNFEDLTDPNSLKGRMNSPNSKVDIRNQGQEAQGIADSIRNGYNSVESATPRIKFGE